MLRALDWFKLLICATGTLCTETNETARIARYAKNAVPVLLIRPIQHQMPVLTDKSLQTNNGFYLNQNTGSQMKWLTYNQFKNIQFTPSMVIQ